MSTLVVREEHFLVTMFLSIIVLAFLPLDYSEQKSGRFHALSGAALWRKLNESHVVHHRREKVGVVLPPVVAG